MALTEKLFEPDSFGKTKELSGVSKWVHDIKTLMTLVPGNDPLQITKGIDLEQYNFIDMGDYIEELQATIEDQIKTFTPDVPLERVVVQLDEDKGRQIFLVRIELKAPYNTKSFTLASFVESLVNFTVSYDDTNFKDFK